jgi:FAD synthase
MKSLSPQKKYLVSLLEKGDWVCSNFIDGHVVRDFRKRISEMNREGFVIKSEVCDHSCGTNHKAGVHRYRLVERAKRPVYEYELVNGVRVPKLTYQPI